MRLRYMLSYVDACVGKVDGWGGAGLCSCTYRRQDLLVPFPSLEKERKMSTKIFAHFTSLESVRKKVGTAPARIAMANLKPET